MGCPRLMPIPASAVTNGKPCETPDRATRVHASSARIVDPNWALRTHPLHQLKSHPHLKIGWLFNWRRGWDSPPSSTYI